MVQYYTFFNVKFSYFIRKMSSPTGNSKIKVKK